MDDWSRQAISQLALQALERERQALRQALLENLRARRSITLIAREAPAGSA